PQLSRPGQALLAAARVQVEGTAAALPRSDDLTALGREHARRRRVHVAEDDALDAAEQEPDARAPLALGRRRPRQPCARPPRRGQLGERAEAARPDGAGRPERERGPRSPWL